MDTYFALGKIIVGFAVIAQLSLLVIYAWALKRNRSRCFTLLAAGALVGLVYAVLGGLPFFISLNLSTHLLIAKATFALLVVGCALGIWGMLLLVRSHLSLVEQASGGSCART
ncbi:hypothetical protein [Dyella agri]|uniref:Uncharacterized protein n=1 Tax=Dyella agri TaxID=1926869 RepID=A0ABW8KCX8_9GAMM